MKLCTLCQSGIFFPSGANRLLALGDIHVATINRTGSQEDFSGREGA